MNITQGIVSQGTQTFSTVPIVSFVIFNIYFKRLIQAQITFGDSRGIGNIYDSCIKGGRSKVIKKTLKWQPSHFPTIPFYEIKVQISRSVRSSDASCNKCYSCDLKILVSFVIKTSHFEKFSSLKGRCLDSADAYRYLWSDFLVCSFGSAAQYPLCWPQCRLS